MTVVDIILDMEVVDISSSETQDEVYLFFLLIPSFDTVAGFLVERD